MSKQDSSLTKSKCSTNNNTIVDQLSQQKRWDKTQIKQYMLKALEECKLKKSILDESFEGFDGSQYRNITIRDIAETAIKHHTTMRDVIKNHFTFDDETEKYLSLEFYACNPHDVLRGLA